jgi:hypothetical protein
VRWWPWRGSFPVDAARSLNDRWRLQPGAAMV